MEVLQRTANRGSISTGGYEIDNSAAFGGANGIQFNPSSDGNRRTWTVSLWVKRSELSVETTIFGSSNTAWAFMDSDWLRFGLHTGSAMYYYDTDNTGTVFRDTSAWYHLVFQLDTTQGTASNRTKLYINGALYTGARGGADTSANIPQNTEMTMSLNTSNIQVGYFYAGGEQLDGYMSEIHFTDGVANDADAFGEYDDDSGIWKPKAYAGSYGTNGFYLEFKESASSSTGIGKDTSGNGHNFSTGGTYPSQATDTPTNNFATSNPLVPLKANTILTEGATNFKNVGSAGWAGFAPSIAVQSGKWYVEFTAAGATTMCGVGNVNDFLNSIYYGNWNTSIGFYGTAGLLFIDGATSGAGPNNTWSGLAYGDGDIVGIALDKDNGCVYMSKNGTFANSGDPTSGSSKTGGVELTKGNSDYSASDYFYIGASQNIDNGILQANYGGYTTDTPSSAATDANGYGTFEYAPPTGYYALCTKNLAEYG